MATTASSRPRIRSLVASTACSRFCSSASSSSSCRCGSSSGRASGSAIRSSPGRCVVRISACRRRQPDEEGGRRPTVPALGITCGRPLIEGRVEEARPLSITDVSRIHVQGGSVIRTSRANPTVRDQDAADPDWRLQACLESLRKLGIDALVTIGGDDTAFSASRLAEAARGDLRVAHVPKTIDNDLPLPRGVPTFGFETARSVGVELVNNLMTDAMTTQRWYLVVAMGRSAGHLALGIGKAAGATLTLIAEEFPGDEPIRLSRLVDVLETSMLKRIAHGRPFGVAVLAEGIGLRLPQDELAKAMPEVERDEHGHVRLAELELDRLLAKLVKDRFKERGEKVTGEGKNIR